VTAQDQALSHFEERPSPIHVAIIMDGNDRWATQRGLPRIEGHRQSVESTRDCVFAAADLGISYLTLFSLFSEDWKRPRIEAAHLVVLLSRVIRGHLAELREKNIKLRIIGSENGLPRNLAAVLREAVSQTEGNTGLQLVIAFNYAARDEIVRAAKHLNESVKQGELSPEAVTQDVFAQHLDTAGIPDPDLIIRTGGEQRISNFLLWQCAYSEFLFLDSFWPDFTRHTLQSAITAYRCRERRFGGLSR
jgi:undecaprenyl diphosphate synthase